MGICEIITVIFVVCNQPSPVAVIIQPDNAPSSVVLSSAFRVWTFEDLDRGLHDVEGYVCAA